MTGTASSNVYCRTTVGAEQVSVNDFMVRAVALALADVPRANALWDGSQGLPKQVSSVDISIAVATDKGLITPIVKAANTKSLQQISQEVCHCLCMPACTTL